MKLKLHATNATKRDEEWLSRNGWSFENDWLDCTKWISSFNKNDVSSFCFMMQEFTSVDLTFDEWKLEW